MWRSTSSPKRIPKSEPSVRPTLSPRSTLTEVLRINQFRVKNTPSPSPGIEKNEPEDEAVALNQDLAVLARVFPDIHYDCLREVLTRFDGDSRLEICTEQLYRYKEKWSKGRTQALARDQDESIPVDEQFRTEQYRSACARLLYKEFSSLNKSAVDAVLAEVNHAFLKARPVLQEISDKSWRATFQSLFRKRKDRDTLPTSLWKTTKAGQALSPTGSQELDTELDESFVKPGREEQAGLRSDQDHALALKYNEKEAELSKALYECQICYSDVSFENSSACTEDGHIVCLNCVRRSLNEAIFGQNWAQSVEPHFSTLKCLAPVEPLCEGHIPSDQLKQAILLERSGQGTWDKFEHRLAENAISESQMSLVRCPFCCYAEAESTYTLEDARKLKWSFRAIPQHYKLIMILLCEFILPTVFLVFVTFRLLFPSLLPNLFYTSIGHIAASQRSNAFRCRNPSCMRRSCLKCTKAYHDYPPHSCHESLLLSLRQSVETARTNAIKRVCPRCTTSFVKSSGCNKLTCICGYSMCYLCRKNIGKTGGNEGGEGYRHFCEHFRPVPGTKCTQCEKCDLYKDEEEDLMVRRAGEEAERAWKEREGSKNQGKVNKDIERIKIDHGGLVGRIGVWERFVRGDWTVQGIADEIVGRVVIVKV